MLARQLHADLFIMATDTDAVYDGWGSAAPRALRRAGPADLDAYDFPAGSMGPKVAAARRFAEMTGKRAAIGALQDLEDIVRGEAGTTIDPAQHGVIWAAEGAPTGAPV